MQFKKPFTTVALIVSAGLFTDSAMAVSVLFVDNETPDASWQTLIEDGGANTYTEFLGQGHAFNLATQEAKDFVNGFDVVIVSGSNSVFNAIRDHGQTWHAQPTPIINLGSYLASGQFTGNSWGFFTSAGTAANATLNDLDITNAADPLWNGVTLINGDTQAPDLYSANRRIARQDAGDLLKAGVTQVATIPGQPTQNVIMYAAPGSIAPGGEAAYFIPGMSGGSAEAVPFNTDGEIVFLNMIDLLTGGGTPALPGDTDGDGDVDDSDLGTSFSNYTGPGGTGKTVADGDTDGDGDVDDGDLGTSFSNYTGPLGPAVPEPTSLALLGLGGLMIARRRRA